MDGAKQAVYQLLQEEVVGKFHGLNLSELQSVQLARILFHKAMVIVLHCVTDIPRSRIAGHKA